MIINNADLLRGKRALFLGSSVTYGSGAGGISFADMLADDGLIVIKEAVSGTTLCDLDSSSYVSRLQRLPYEILPDFTVCQLSTNDAARKLPLGNVEKNYGLNSFKTDTVAGAIEFIIAYVKNQWRAPTVFYTGTYYESAAYNGMVSLLHVIADKWSMPVIDMWNDKRLNSLPDEVRRRLVPDGIHPTVYGYRDWWTPYIKSALTELAERKII